MADLNPISSRTANYVARQTGYAMADGRAQGGSERDDPGLASGELLVELRRRLAAG
jgi:hypothetical protein